MRDDLAEDDGTYPSEAEPQVHLRRQGFWMMGTGVLIFSSIAILLVVNSFTHATTWKALAFIPFVGMVYCFVQVAREGRAAGKR